MARPFHVHVPHFRLRGDRSSHPAALLLILLLAALVAIWLEVPPVASVLPIQPPG